jgi:hypothetical protein
MGRWTSDLLSLGAHHREVKALLRELQDAGCWIGRNTGTGHLMLRHTSGKYAGVPMTPSDPRSLKNSRAHIRRVLEGRS